MSKYTTEVRYICEHDAGLTESADAGSVDNVISKSWNKIFTTNCHFFDEDYRSILCSKILKHYYLREISSETVGIWKLWVNTKLEEIMPYYNMLYESALLEFDPFKDVDYQRTHDGESEDTHDGESDTTKDVDTDYSSSEAKTGRDTMTETGTVTDARSTSKAGTYSGTDSKTDRYSDTPQGTIANADLEGNAYLTNVRLIGENNSGSNGENIIDNNTETRNLTDTTVYGSGNNIVGSSSVDDSTHNENSYIDHNTNNYIEHVFGKMSTTPYSELLNKFRETFLNIDMMVIEEFDELFLRLW